MSSKPLILRRPPTAPASVRTFTRLTGISRELASVIREIAGVQAAGGGHA